MPDLPRYVPEEPLPPYAFVPGQSPHPISDPAGHSFGHRPETPAAPDPERWHECRPYLRGLDLFNHGYYWEAHEVWESLWQAAGRKGVLADFLKGLIKLAAAGVKHREGKPEGVKSHVHRTAELWRGTARSVGAEGSYLGFQFPTLIELAETTCQKGWPEAPPVLLPSFTLPFGGG
jgi:hypothetical protein